MTDISRESVAPVEEKEQMIKKLSFIIKKKNNLANRTEIL